MDLPIVNVVWNETGTVQIRTPRLANKADAASLKKQIIELPPTPKSETPDEKSAQL